MKTIKTGNVKIGGLPSNVSIGGLPSNVSIGGNAPFVLIAGPCVIEDEKTTLAIAGKLKSLTNKLNIPFVFKASYDKANRTSVKSYRGPGIKKGLPVLAVGTYRRDF